MSPLSVSTQHTRVWSYRKTGKELIVFRDPKRYSLIQQIDI